MQRDLRSTPGYQEVEAYFSWLLQPGSDRPFDAADPAPGPDGSILFTGSVQDDLASPPITRIYRVGRGDKVQAVTAGPHDRLARWSPDGNRWAYVTDPAGDGAARARIVTAPGEDRTLDLDGAVEYLAWSPDGASLLLGLAGLGADLAGAQGGTAIRPADDLPDWLPEIRTPDAAATGRHLMVHRVDDGDTSRVDTGPLNVWEATWCGPNRIAAVVSNGTSEGAWYRARLVVIDLASGDMTEIFTPDDQIGWPAANAGGDRLAFVEAVCSDRWIVAGVVRLADLETGAITEVDTADVDVSWLAWETDRLLRFAGSRGLETVIGEIDLEAGSTREIWAASDRTFGAWHPAAALLPDGLIAAVAESYDAAPAITVIGDSGDRTRSRLGDGPSPARAPEPIRWTAPDGLELEGWLVRPEGPGPHATVLDIHGGPVWAHRNRWQGRRPLTEMLVRSGFAVFSPNPRGSSGRGQDFARLVQRDMGGADTFDSLSGLDALVERGVADPARLGVTGVSYGGFMSAWLIATDRRFAAAVVVSPVTNWYSQHGTSQIPFFDELFLDGRPDRSSGQYWERSPLFKAQQVRCPTLIVAGGRDRNTPPGQALEFYTALVEAGVETALATYPEAGHGARRFPEVIDATTRSLDWFRTHLAPG